jgi:2'-5' RNA ligase
MKRTFFAVHIHPNEKITSLLPDIQNYLAGEKIKWVLADHLHLTLKFLGETQADYIQSIINTVSGHLTEIPAITLDLFSVGVFKSMHNPHVIWIGMSPCSSLQDARRYLNTEMRSFGFPADDTEFLPHLTLGRVKEIKQKEKLGILLEKYRNVSFGKVNVTEILFYESVLKPEGPDYIPLARFPLR